MKRVSEVKRNPFISVIVPFYNISECVDYCIDCLLDQTYDNYEIVCIDDGSTDSTYNKLIDASGRNSKIRVYRKSNGGLSDARNFGIQVCRGEYVTFVDGDDVVSPLYLEALVSAMCDNANAMVVGQVKTIAYDEARSGRIEWSSEHSSRAVTKSQMLTMLMFEQVMPGAWSRLAKKDIYVRNPFPKSAYYEEIATAAVFIDESESIVLLDEPIYGYVMRSGSIVHKKTVPLSQIEDYLTALKAFTGIASRYSAKDPVALVYFQALHYSRIYRLVSNVNDNDIYLDKIRKFTHEYVRTNIFQLIRDGSVPLLSKCRFLLFSVMPSNYEKIFNQYDKKIKKVS